MRPHGEYGRMARWVLPIVLGVVGICMAQEPPYRVGIQLEKARQEYEYWASEWKRAQELYRQGLISERELRRTERDFQNAALAYQEAQWAAQGFVFRIRVERAVKYLDRDGSVRVRLFLRRDKGDARLAVDIPMGPVYVALMSPDGTVIARPYEHRIAVLWPESRAAVEFVLLEDADRVRVRIAEGGQVYELPILLERGGQQDRLALTAEPFSQTADLGSQATYRLRVEYFGTTPQVYRLQVSGLPSTWAYDFREAETQVRLTQVRLDPMTRTRTLLLTVYLPERLPEPMQVDRPTAFWVEAVPTGAAVSQGSTRVRLELIPRGVGRLQVSTANLYGETRTGGEMTQVWTVANVGERDLERVTVRVEPPWQWTVYRSPETIPRLGPGEKTAVRVTLRPPPDVAVGDYEASVWAEGWTGNQPTRSDVLRVRVHVAARGSLIGTVVFFGALVLLLAGIVAVGIHLMRR